MHVPAIFAPQAAVVVESAAAPADKYAEYREYAEKAFPYAAGPVAVVAAYLAYRISRFAGGRLWRGARGLYVWATQETPPDKCSPQLLLCRELLAPANDARWGRNTVLSESQYGKCYQLPSGGPASHAAVIGGKSAGSAWLTVSGGDKVPLASAREEREVRRLTYATLTRLRAGTAEADARAAAAAKAKAEAEVAAKLAAVLHGPQPPAPPAADRFYAELTKAGIAVPHACAYNSCNPANDDDDDDDDDEPEAPAGVAAEPRFVLFGRPVDLHRIDTGHWRIVGSFPGGLYIAADGDVAAFLKATYGHGTYRLVPPGVDPATALDGQRATFTVV